jgi:hypothetical protein
MGFYIPGPPKGKVEMLVTDYSGVILLKPPVSFNMIPKDRLLVCVVDNGIFEAAGVMTTQREYEAWTLDKTDDCRKVWLTVDRDKASEACGLL